MKTLLVAVGLCAGTSSVWAIDVASYNFDGKTTPFTISDAARLSASYELQTGSETDFYVKYSCGNMNAVAFAYYDFSSSVSDAATVTIDFDFNIATVAGHALLSIADASVHTASGAGFSGKNNTGYGSNGAIFNLGCYRASGNNKFGINSTQTDYVGLDAWCHASVVVDNSSKKVSYVITKGTEELASKTDVAFLNASANRCSQIDLYIGTNASGNGIKIDNITITKTVSEASHNYTINAMAGTIKLQELASGIANENAGYSVCVPKMIVSGGKYYVLNSGQANMTHCSAEYTMGTIDEVKEIYYSLDESVVYFKEAEEITASANVSSSLCSGGTYVDYYAGPTPVSFTEAGRYELETYVASREGKSSLEVYPVDGTVSIVQIAKGGSQGIRTCQFDAEANSTLRVGGPYYSDKFQNSLGFDYVLIRKVQSPVTIGAAGYSTFASAYPLDLTEAAQTTADVVAYKASVSGNKVNFTAIDQTVAANTGFLLEGTAGATVKIPVAATGTAVAGNEFLVNEGGATFTADADYYYFGLMKDSNLEFGTFDPATLAIPADKAYLKVAKSNFSGGARLEAVFNEATGINAVNGEGFTVNGYYNLNGQRISQPTRGLYIMNGKKYVVK